MLRIELKEVPRVEGMELGLLLKGIRGEAGEIGDEGGDEAEEGDCDPKESREQAERSSEGMGRGRERVMASREGNGSEGLSCSVEGTEKSAKP